MIHSKHNEYTAFKGHIYRDMLLNSKLIKFTTSQIQKQKA